MGRRGSGLKNNWAGSATTRVGREAFVLSFGRLSKRLRLVGLPKGSSELGVVRNIKRVSRFENSEGLR